MAVVVQIQGFTFWLNFIPARARARLIAENIRRSYGGRFPWGQPILGDPEPGSIQIQLTDGSAWNLSPVAGRPAPQKTRGIIGWLRSWIFEIQTATGLSPYERWEATCASTRQQIEAAN